MKRYGDWAPTAFDQRGAFLEDDRRDWLVLPVSQTRDSGPLDQSNFETAQKILTDGREDCDDFEVHRFGHWGPGWFEIIIVKPDSRAAELADSIADRMADYPVLDESDYSRREWEDFCGSWDSWGCRDFVKSLVKAFGLGERTKELLEDADTEVIREFYMDHASIPYESDDSGAVIRAEYTVQRDIEAEHVLALIRQLRAAARSASEVQS